MSWKLPENNVKNLQSFLGSICLAASQELAKVVQISTCCKLNHHLERSFSSALPKQPQLQSIEKF
jgi:hypothetical protein